MTVSYPVPHVAPLQVGSAINRLFRDPSASKTCANLSKACSTTLHVLAKNPNADMPSSDVDAAVNMLVTSLSRSLAQGHPLD